MPPSIDMNVSSKDTITNFVEDNQKVVINASIIAGAMLLHFAIYVLMKKVALRTDWIFDDELVKRSKWPTFALFPTLSLKIGWRTTTFIEDDNTNSLIQQVLNILAIIEFAWLSVNVLRVGFSSLVRQNKWANSPDNWKQRKAVTQIAVLKRLSYVIVFFGMVSGIVFTFPSGWEIGMSLMASAGAAGLILGLAAKPGLENIIASLTIAFSQPITLEDEVIVEGEYGRVEEIRSQYVVVRTWDGRRLILPLSYFTSKSFQNWSKTSTWKIGVALFYFDPLILAHLPEIRERLTLILTTTEPARQLWDGKVVNCGVTEIRPDGMVEVRVLASAKSSGDTFDLRCTIRELLMSYVVQKWPGALVRSRGEVRMFNDESDQWNRGDKAKKMVDTLASAFIESTAAIQ